MSDGPLLNALLNCASGATGVSLHHGGGVGIGYSQHAGVVIVCDGTPAAAARIERVLWNDPALGVARHAECRVVPQHPLDACRGGRRAVADDDHAGMLRIADADAAAVMQRNPGGPARAVEQRVEQRPVRHRI